MSKLVPSTTQGRVAAVCSLLFAGALLTMVFVDNAHAAPYTDPFFTSNSPAQESALSEVADLAFVTECVSGKCRVLRGTCPNTKVDVRTGELHFKIALFRTPGVRGDNAFWLSWRSMLSGPTQFGHAMVPSWETTAEYVVVNQQDPNGPGGHLVRIRRGDCGRIDVFNWNGATYVAPPDVFDSLTESAGIYTLTDKHGATLTFDANGMPNVRTDTNGNVTTYTYNGYQVTGITDDRGMAYTFTRNANGYVTSMTDPASRSWTCTYDASDNLKTITTPPTADQPAGIVVTLAYDANNRLTSFTDGRGNTVWQMAYAGAGGQISTVTIDGNSISYSYTADRTDRTDRNGSIYRYYHSGSQVTKTDLLVGGQAAYVTQYRYSGVFIANVVYPRGNRVDFTWDAKHNLTEQRHRTTDTATNDPSDIVEAWTYNASSFMLSYTDPLGNTTNYARDAGGNVTQVTHPTVADPVPQNASRSYVYNSKGQVTRVTDEAGNETDYTYFSSGSSIYLLQKIEVDPNGLDLETTLTYNAQGDVTTRTDPRGNTFTTTWDSLRRLVSDQPPATLGYERKYSYDGNGNTVTREVKNVDKDGNTVASNPWITTTLTWTPTDDVATIVEEIDASTTRTTTLEYDANQNRVRVIKPEGNKEKWEYNERDWVTARVRGETDPAASTTSFSHDENGNLVTVTDGRGNATTFTYDMFDRRTKRTNALSHYTEVGYDKNSNPTGIWRKNSGGTVIQRETRYYDSRNRLWKTSGLFKDPSQTYTDSITIFERLATNQITKITDPRGHITTHSYDAALRRTKTTDDGGNEWSWTLDGNGNPIAWSVEEVDGEGSVTHDFEATYDELNRGKTMVEIDRTNSTNRLTTQFHFDSRSNLVFQVNPEGDPTRWTWDGLGRMVKRERALTVGATIDDFQAAQVTQWGFDANSRLVSHKDDGAHETTWDYDALDRVTAITYPDASSSSYEYDASHNATKTTDAAGNVIEDTFDVLNRNTSRSITLASGFVGTTSEMRIFDALNRMTSNADNDYKVEYEYAVIGLQSRVYSTTQSYVGSTSYPKTVTSTYDASGNRITEAYPSGSNLSLAYAYDSIDQLSSIGDGTATLASYTRVGLRNKTTTFQSGATTTLYYTGFRDEVESIRHETSAPATILRLDYAYNKVHDPLYERYGAAGASGDAFEYDKLRRLTVAWMGSSNPASPSGNPYVKKIEYNYDDDGNRTSVVTTPYGQSASTTSYTTNNLNQYTAVGGTSQVWDGNGSRTDDGTLTFEPNYKNLIVKVRDKSSGTLLATYKHDAEGRRVEKDVDGVVERYILSDPHNASRIVSVFDGSNTWKRNFVWSDRTDGIEVLEQADVLDYDNDGNTTEITRSFYHRNAIGSVMEITDQNEATVVSYRYDPYGKVTITRNGSPQSNDPLGNPWMFSTRFYDPETGLYYDETRHYDARTGSFAQRIGGLAGYVAGPNLYTYADSAPTGRYRVRGLEEPMLPLLLAPPPDEEEEAQEKSPEKEKKKERKTLEPRPDHPYHLPPPFPPIPIPGPGHCWGLCHGTGTGTHGYLGNCKGNGGKQAARGARLKALKAAKAAADKLCADLSKDEDCACATDPQDEGTVNSQSCKDTTMDKVPGLPPKYQRDFKGVPAAVVTMSVTIFGWCQ